MTKHIKSFLSMLTIPLLLLVAFGATSFAAGSATPEDGSLLDLLTPIWEAATGKHWWLAGSLALVASVTAMKKYAPAGRLRNFVDSAPGVSLILLVGSFAGAVATGLVAAGTDAITPSMAWAAFQVAIGAAGGYAIIKSLLVDPLLASEWYKTKAPAWLKGILSIATWAFTKPDVAKEAEKAGDNAVAANPPKGTDGTVENTDL